MPERVRAPTIASWPSRRLSSRVRPSFPPGRTCSTTSVSAPRTSGTRARDSSTGCPTAAASTSRTRRVDRHAAGARREPPGAPLARQGRGRARLHLRRPRPPDEPLRQRARAASASARATSSACSPGASRSSTSPRSGPSRTGASSARSSRRSGPSRSARGWRSAKREGRSSPPRRSTSGRSPASATSLPDLEHVILVGAGRARDRRAGHRRLRPAAWSRRPTSSRSGRPIPEDVALVHFTSGTTGTPKGAVHVHEAVVAHHVDRQARPRPPPGRRLLVHRRPRLGDRHLLRHHRAALERRHE